MILEYISLAADLAIIFLLAIQSFVLWKLKDPIISTAKNSEVVKKLFNIGDNKSERSNFYKNYPEQLILDGILHCLEPYNKSHIHTKRCL